MATHSALGYIQKDKAMARGRYLSLEEARRMDRLDQFAKEHPAEGDWDRFDRLFEAMAHGEAPLQKRQTPPKSVPDD